MSSTLKESFFERFLSFFTFSVAKTESISKLEKNDKGYNDNKIKKVKTFKHRHNYN